MAKKEATEQSDPKLLDCRPIRLLEHEETDSGLVVLLRPRFMKGLAAKFIQPRLKKPHIRITLDRIGSFVWKRCDGKTTVREILAEMEESLGHGPPKNGAEIVGKDDENQEEEEKGDTNKEEMLKAPERLRIFLGQLTQNNMLKLKYSRER